MQKDPHQTNMISSNLLVFLGKSMLWGSISLIGFVSMAVIAIAIAFHTPGGKKLVLCPVYDATIASLGSSPQAMATLKLVSSEWRQLPRPSADWAYIPAQNIVVPVPVQTWTKLPQQNASELLMHLKSDVMEVKLERSSSIGTRTQLRRLREQVLADPIALFNPAKLGEIVYLWQDAVQNLERIDKTAALREAFREDLSKSCSTKLSWKKTLARLGMANEKIKSRHLVSAAWRNVSPASLTLVAHEQLNASPDTSPVPHQNGFGWSVQVIFNTNTKINNGKITGNSMKLTYSGLSEPMKNTVMQQIGLIRDTSLADHELPASFFNGFEERGLPPIAQGDRSATRL